MEQKLYDVAIIGGGPGGYTAGLYCARSGFSVVVLEKLSPGGQMATTGQVDNYPGFEGGVDGFELGEKMQRGAERFGVETRFAEVTGVELAAVPKVIQTSEGEVRARAGHRGLSTGDGTARGAGAAGPGGGVLRHLRRHDVPK